MIIAGLAIAVWIAVYGVMVLLGVSTLEYLDIGRLGYMPIVKRVAPQRGATNESVAFQR